MKKIFFNIILILFLFFVYFLICANSYSVAVSSDISSSIFRLHVIANSNSEEDQTLKYLVRDNILDYINTLISSDSSKQDVMQIINENLYNIQKVAENTINENGYNYPVNIEIGKYYFPTKSYGDISIPSGNYDGLRVKIGNAEGKNWWCVMFPPLCFVDVTSGILPEESKETLENNLEEEDYEIISSNSNEIKLKFKIIEFFENFKQTLSKK